MKKSTTTTTTTATANTEKVNVILSLDEVYAKFVTGIGTTPIKLNYSNAKSQPYCGTNDFSVNIKKSFFNVYMSTENSNICKKVNAKLEIFDNTSDTTKKQLRCKLIRFDDMKVFEKCLNAVLKTKTTTATATE